MRGFLRAVLVWTALSLATPGFAQSGVVVVELYTSQGCSSCPPADAMLEKLAARDDVIALGLHVDYWDYLGWKDQLGRPENTSRQKAYAHVAGSRSIYTPQLVIAGTDHVVGHRTMEVMDSINQRKNSASPVTMQLSRKGTQVSISARSTSASPMIVQLVRYVPASNVAIRRGENRGKVINYVNAVTQWKVVRNWNGSSPLNLSVKAPGEEPVVVIIQAEGPGQILAAARLR